jgi:hypothetical protein
MNPIVSIIGNGSDLVIWSAAGGMMVLDKERTLKISKIFKLNDKISNVIFSKNGGWFIMMHGKSIVILDDVDSEPYIIKTPGPVLDAFFESEKGIWRWTGWRHDGKLITKNNEFSFKERDNIGIHISNSKILTNDGVWEDYSSS